MIKFKWLFYISKKSLNDKLYLTLTLIIDFFNFKKSGSGEYTLLSGWILRFFDKKDAEVTEDNDIQADFINFPVTVVNALTGNKKNFKVVGGFCGINKTGEVYRPQMSMAVVWNGETENATDEDCEKMEKLLYK